MSPPGVPNHPILSIATPSRDNIPYTTTKGLLNEPGQNNCFLNSAVQVLWHLDIFRRSFRDLMGHACMAESCIFCALKELFSQLQYSQESALPPDALRKALAESFSDQQRFQLGFMDDAAECFENILLRIHQHIAHGESQDMCNASHCIPHQKFAMTLVEQTVCGSCGATSEPLTYTQMVHYVSTSTLVYQVRNSGVRSSPFNPTLLPFGQLLRKAGNMGDVRMCPSHCGAVIQISRTLMNWPEIVSVGLVWNSERPSLEHIMEVFSTIGTTMLLGDVFSSVIEKKWTENCTHHLVGVVTYYGKHYSTFFFHTKLRVWIYFDDATVRQIGPHWEQVVEKCRKGRYQPLLLLYATPDGTPVNTDNAPKQITQICPTKTLNPKTNQASLLRRSITPSPEKPNIGSTRRAITPNPECSLLQKPPLPRAYNEYQNLSVIQNSLHKSPEVTHSAYKRDVYKKLEMTDVFKPPVSIHRTSSNGSSSGIEMSDHNFPRRRDSGNWSGDRNSASSASSTTMENPYLYLVGKVPTLPAQSPNVPESPTLVKSDSSSAGSAIYDAGYDSYSLSSNDSSSMTPLQHTMKMSHLAKIPEDYNNTISTQITQSCDVLCDEADELLVKSRQLEDEHDLVLALALCNAAATKARAAMNAPYNNPQTLTLARMKHNTCIMRARSLHRRMTQSAPSMEPVAPEIRHTREGSSGSGRHSRQNSRDKGQHSRQNSKELLNVQQLDKPAHKNIEIYATLPKRNKDFFKNKIESIAIDDANAQNGVEKQVVKESRGFFSRSKQKDSKSREKRSRSEDRSKRVVEFTLTPEIIDIKPKPKPALEEKEKDKEKEKDTKSKKQHKIRRKLMGGLMKRKNRSMPDLTDAANAEIEPPQTFNSSVDDSKLGIKNSEDKNKNSGYLSEGHLEFSSNNTNPNLKKSKLMKKSFYASAGRILSVPKVPPPPPLRTTSQLSISKPQLLKEDEIVECVDYKNPTEINNFTCNFTQYDTSIIEKLKLDQSRMMSANPNESNTFVTLADVHRKYDDQQNSNSNSKSADEVDCCIPKTMELPPYPSPAGSALHSRQASEEFPPPPPPLDLSGLDEHLPQSSPIQPKLKEERNFMFNSSNSSRVSNGNDEDVWLKELQAKQAALKIKRMNSFNGSDDGGLDEVNTQKNNSIKSLVSKFENKSNSAEEKPTAAPVPAAVAVKKTVTPEIVAEEMKEVEEINATLQETLNKNQNHKQLQNMNMKTRFGKKKSVSFCDQVILVATAEDQKDDEYIPNPILERVLRSAINKSEAENASSIQNIQETCETRKEVSSPDSNLFDITMRNTMENSKVINHNVVTNAKIPDNMQLQKLPIAPTQSVYQSVAFAHKNSANVAPPQTYVAPQQSNGVPHNLNQHAQGQYNSNPSNPQYNYGAPQSSHAPYVSQMAPRIPQNVYHHQQPAYQQTPLPTNGSGHVYGHNMQQNHQGYGYAPGPNYQAQENVQQRYYQPQNYNGEQHQTNQQYPNYHHQNGNTSIYSTSPQTAATALHKNVPHYGNDANHRQVHPEYQAVPQHQQVQPQQHQQVSRPNYMHAPLTPLTQKTHNILSRNGIYQSVPFPIKNQSQAANPYQRVPQKTCANPEIYKVAPQQPTTDKNYHPVPVPNNLDFSHEATDKAVFTPILVNNANNSIPDRTKCNLCRKKIVASSNLYCADCEYYMSRFKPKT